MKALPYILFLSAFICFSSCRKDEVDIVTEQKKVERPRVYHDANITGKVINQNDVAIKAEVSILGEKMESDEDGGFLFVNTRVNARGSLVKSIAKGHMPGYQTVHPKLNEVVSIEIVLEEIKSAIPLNSDEPSELTLSSNANAIIGNSLFEYYDGSPFSGNAAIIFQYFDEGEAASRLPVSLHSQDPVFNVGPLELEGAFVILAFDESGEILKLQNETSFNLTISKSIPNSSLFNLNENKELWVEDLNTNFESSAFSTVIDELGFKAIGRQLKESKVIGKIVDANGDGIPSFSAVIKGEQIEHNIITDYLGYYSADLALNKTYDLVALDPCIAEEATLNFYTDNATNEISDLVLSSTMTGVSFELMNCSFEKYKSESGLIVSTEISGQRMNYRFGDSRIDLSLLFCTDKVVLSIYDGSQMIETIGLEELIELEEGNDLVRHHMCESDVEAIISIDGEMVEYRGDNYTIVEDGTPPNRFFGFSDLSPDGYIGVNGMNSKGEFPVQEMTFLLPKSFECNNNECGSVSIIVTKYGANIGDQIIGHIAGEYNGIEVLAYINDTVIN